jgi:hypothetical protein
MDTKYFELKDFNGIELEGPFELEITRSDKTEVSITADDFPHIKVEKIGDNLIIKRQGIEWFAPFHHRPKATVKLPSLAVLKIAGASNVKVENIQSENHLSVILSGASRVEANNITAGSVEIKVTGASNLTGDIKAVKESTFEVSGASRIELEGAGGNTTMKLSGASKAELNRFPLQNADIEISGASNANINLNGRLNARVSGASNLLWSGTPIMGDIQITGASKLHRK